MMATLSTPIATLNSFSILSWLASAYLIATAAIQPLIGRLTDIYGRCAGILMSNFLFAAGNLVCGLVTQEWSILDRVMAGIGGGGLFAIQTIVASDLTPLRKRGLWQKIGNIIFGISSATGGAAVGWINDA
jgi:MFS family permease